MSATQEEIEAYIARRLSDDVGKNPTAATLMAALTAIMGDAIRMASDEVKVSPHPDASGAIVVEFPSVTAVLSARIDQKMPSTDIDGACGANTIITESAKFGDR